MSDSFDKINDLSNIDYLGNSPLRLAILIFGYAFSGITTSTFNKDGQKKGKRIVQCGFAPKSAIVSYINEQQRLPDSPFPEIGKRLPLMSYDIVGMEYDRSRQTNSILKHITISNPNLADGKYIYTVSPFNFDFQLNIWTKDFQPAFEILNQIIPAFRPEVSIGVKTQKDARMITDAKIILNTFTRNDNYNEAYTSTSRLIDWQLNFKMIMDWPQIIDDDTKTDAIIREVRVDIDFPPFSEIKIEES